MFVSDLSVAEPPKSHRFQFTVRKGLRVPVRLDPSFDLHTTTNLGRMIERWGPLPLSFLQQFEQTEYTYGFIGTEDFTMYPLLVPGSFIQIDESKKQIVMEAWRSEY